MTEDIHFTIKIVYTERLKSLAILDTGASGLLWIMAAERYSRHERQSAALESGGSPLF